VKAVTITELKRDLPLLLGQIAKGASILIQKGRRRENVAILAPFHQPSPRRLGSVCRTRQTDFQQLEDH